MTATGLSKAKIIKLNKQGGEAGSVEVMFNPKELTITKRNNWKQEQNPKANVPDVEFSGGGPADLKMQLFFDTHAGQEDVRKKYTDAIYQFMQVDEELTDSKNQKGRPPTVRFQWGETIGFNAVITSISQRFTLFMPNGSPVRAVLDVTFSQVEDELFYPKQNPTSGGIGGERIWTVKAGDTLASIAYSEYGDTKRWRVIADANRLTHVRDLQPGTVLVIPNA